MFDYTITHWLAFFTASILLTLTPGPDLAYILAQTTRRGRSAGFLAMYGIWTGAFFHVFLAALGLSAILVTSATAFSFVKYMGAAYLIYIGVRSILHKEDQSTPKNVHNSHSGIFKQGVIVAALNPKTAIFFLSFLPQFVVAGSGPVSLQLLLHGTLVIAVAVFIEPPLIFASSKLSSRAQNNPTVSKWLDRALGTVFVGMGMRLALFKGAEM